MKRETVKGAKKIILCVRGILKLFRGRLLTAIYFGIHTQKEINQMSIFDYT